jgi:hypothetical protein
MPAPLTLWQLRGQTGSVTECRLYELASGQFEIRIVRAESMLFGERYTSADEAQRHAQDYHDSLVGKGWLEAA